MSGAARCAAIVLAAVAFQAVLLFQAFGQAPDSLGFRRVFVPEETLSNQIRGLVPLKREEFERRLALAAKQADPRASQAIVRIEQATFRARLDGEHLKDGEAELAIVATTNEPSMLGLGPLNVTLESAHWRSADHGAAVIGADPAGALQCLVERSGTLDLKWSHPAKQYAAGVSTFDLQLPDAPRKRLEIVAACDVELAVDSGLIVGKAELPPDRGQCLWTIELGGQTHVTLCAMPVAPQHGTAPLVVVREATKYNVLQSIVDVETNLTIDILREPLKELKLIVEPGLQITTVNLDDQSLPFRVVSDGPDGPSVAHVALPAELAGLGRVLEIEATAPWPAASGWALPRIKVAEGLFQEGRAEIQSPGWLRLQARPMAGCVQIEAAPATAGRPSDRFMFQLFESDTAVEISLNEAAAPLREESGTQINVESSQVAGVLIAELTSTGGTHFSVLAQVPRQWIIDSVETQPPEVLADRALNSTGQGPHRLRVNLARPISPQRPVRLVIRGHCRRPANDQDLGDEFFRLARFTEVGDNRRLVAVRVNDPSAELRLVDDENVDRVDPNRLTPGELQLFESAPGTLLLESKPAGGIPKAKLQAVTARYRAEVLVRADVGRGGIQQTVSLRCQPEASSIGSIVVRLSPRPRGEVTWRLADDDLRELPAVLESQFSATTADEAVYRLMLPRSRSSALEAIGQWSSSQTGASEISLASLPAATRQTNVVEIHSPDRSIHVRTSEVQSLPQPLAADDRFTTLCGRYRYEAGRRNLVVVEPLPSGTIQQGAWIEMLQLTSYFPPDGIAQHEATFTIRNMGASAFRIRLPASAGECRRVVEGTSEEALDTIGSDNAMLLPLPEGQRRTTVRVRYSSTNSVVGMWPFATAIAPIPQVDLPVVAQTWRVWLPPGLATVSRSNGSNSNDQASSASAGLRVGKLADVMAGPELASRLPFWPRRKAMTTNADFAGWSDFDLELPHSSEATLSVYRPATISAWSMCLGLVAVALPFWLSVRARWIVPAAGVLAAVAIASPSPIAGLLGGISLGLLANGIWLLFRPRAIQAGPVLARPTRPASRTLPSGAVTNLVLLGLVGFASDIVAAPSDAQVGDKTVRPRVVFPIDNNQQPIGDYVFLEGVFYEALHRASDAASSNRPAWLMECAHYGLPAAVSSHAGGAAVDEMQAAFDFHTFQATTVHLPLRRDQILLLEGRARLDGQPVTLAWEAEGQALTLPIAEPGKHRLELSLGATAHSTVDSFVLDITVPPAAKSTVSLPAGARGAKVGSTGASGRLTVKWPKLAVAADGGALAFDADQFSLWKVRSGSVVLEGRFRLRPLGGAVREAVIEVDPRLRLLPGLSSGPIGSVKLEEGVPNLLKVELAEAASADVEFRLSWLWPEASGVGTLLLPRVGLRAGRVLRDWTAVSAESGLEIEGASTAAAPWPAELVRVWPDANVAGNLLLAGSTGGRRSIVVRPAASIPHVDQTTDWSISGSLAQAVYTAKLTLGASTRFEHRVKLPLPVKVNQVGVTQAGRSAAIRWVQERNGELIVSLLEAPAGEQTLTVAADLALPKDKPQTQLPAIALKKVIEGDCVVRIYRQQDVQLQWQLPDGWSHVGEMEVGQFRRGLGRLVAALRRNSAEAASPSVSWMPNRPQVRGTLVARADEADGDWRGEANLKLAIAGGVVDELRLSIPEEWSGPFEIEPVMDQKLESNPSDPRQQLVLRPREAVSGSVEIKLRGPIQGGSSGVQAPDVTLVGDHSVERFVLLDRGSAGQQVDWEISGLLAAGPRGAAQLPAAWRDTGGDLFRVVGPRFDATARTRQAGSEAPRVRLADLRAVVHPGRRLAITATLTVQPFGMHELVFSLPEGCRLVQALVDDVPAPCTPGGLRTWSMPAPSDALPYAVTITYDTYLASGAASATTLQLAEPVLAGMVVERSLWTIEPKDPGQVEGSQLLGTATLVPSDVADGCSPTLAELTRLQTAVRSLEAIISAQGSRIPPAVVAESFARWRRAVATSRSRLLRMQLEADEPGDVAKELQSAELVASRVRQRLVQSGVLDEDENVDQGGAAEEAVESPSVIHFWGKANATALYLTWQSPATNRMTSRAAIACILALASVLAGLVGRSVVVREWLMSHGAFVVGALGIAWWLVAPLGWLGWIPMLAAIWCSIRSAWPRSHFEGGSTIQRWSGSQAG